MCETEFEGGEKRKQGSRLFVENSDCGTGMRTQRAGAEETKESKALFSDGFGDFYFNVPYNSIQT